jgi:DNA-binding transcriptional regulator YbjK
MQLELTPRQEHLLSSAITVVAGSGMRGLTHRAVDRAAGLPEGSCSVYYRTRSALLTALTDFSAARMIQDVSAMAARLPDPEPGKADEHVRELLHRWLAEPSLLITISELGFEAVRSPELAGPLEKWRTELTALVERIMTRGPEPMTQSGLRAKACVACLDGILMSALVSVPSGERREYLDSMLDLVLGAISSAQLP